GSGRAHEPRIPIPAVADPQVRIVDRPVRDLRVRRLRPLHHVVPGRHRRHRGGRRDSSDRRRGGGGGLVSPQTAPAPSSLDPEGPPARIAVITRIVPETPDSSTYWARFRVGEGEGYSFEPGQFNMLYLFGIGEVAISISSDPSHPQLLGHTV